MKFLLHCDLTELCVNAYRYAGMHWPRKGFLKESFRTDKGRRWGRRNWNGGLWYLSCSEWGNVSPKGVWCQAKVCGDCFC
jgi:hypothetical protein